MRGDSRLGLDDLVFDAWLGIARSHAYGTRNHGAAAVVLDMRTERRELGISCR